MKNKQVTHILNSGRCYGGAENLSRLIHSHFRQCGIDYKTYTLKNGENTSFYEEANEGGWILTKDFWRRIKQTKVVMASDRRAIFFSYILSYIYNINVVGVIHGESESKFTNFVTRMFWGKIESVIFVTQDLKNLYETKFGTGQQSEVINNTCNEVLFNYHENLPSRISEELSFLFCGRLEKVKNLDNFLKAICKLDEFNWKLHIIGDGSLRIALQNKVNSSTSKNKIFFHGAQSQEQIRKIYESCNVFILPSFHEGGSVSLLEAMSFGLFSLTSKAKGNRETLGETGVYFDFAPDSIEILLREVLNRKLDLEHYRNIQHQRYLSKFSNRTMFEKYKALLHIQESDNSSR